jgi:carbonic anhydrase
MAVLDRRLIRSWNSGLGGVADCFVQSGRPMSTERLNRLLAANADFATRFDRGELRAPPRERLAVLTCMDCRIAVEELFGLEVGDVAVIRNAGAVASDDAIRSLLVTRHVLGTDEIVVMAHTGCGLLGLDDHGLEARLTSEFGAPSATTFGSFDDLDGHVREQVGRIRAHPWLGDAAVHGLVYDVGTGAARLVE